MSALNTFSKCSNFKRKFSIGFVSYVVQLITQLNFGTGYKYINTVNLAYIVTLGISSLHC